MDQEEKAARLKKVIEKVRTCTMCRLSETRTNVVPGEGSAEAKVLFVGEGPGQREDEQGRPFCGPAGKFLDEMLDSINLSRKSVYITNIVKCRPPGNRDPEDTEKDPCWLFLEEQINIINPKLIVCLGRHSMMRLIPGQASISKIHGQPLRRPDSRIYLPLYHPSAALHNGSLRSVLLKDFALIPPLIKKIEAEESKKTKEEVKKQKLF